MFNLLMVQPPNLVQPFPTNVKICCLSSIPKNIHAKTHGNEHEEKTSCESGSHSVSNKTGAFGNMKLENKVFHEYYFSTGMLGLFTDYGCTIKNVGYS